MKEELRICNKCRYETHEALGQCPKCGRRLFSTKHARVSGWVFFTLGMLLAGLMGTISILAAPMLLQPGEFIGSTRFSGTAGQGAIILALFGFLIAVGLIFMVNGLWQIKTGRRNKWLLYIGYALIAMTVMTVSASLKALDK